MVGLTLGIYYFLPWFNWGQGRQAFLIDLPNRKFNLFAWTFWPQDLFFLTAILVISALSLFLFTAIAGRVWCGFTCPQTVWTEVFLWIERQIDGDRPKQMKLAQLPWNHPEKLLKKSAKHFVWILFSLWTGFTFVGFVTPIRELQFVRRASVARAVGNVLDPVLQRRHLRQRRLAARAGVPVHVSVRALPGRDVRPQHADHFLRSSARRAARLAQTRRGSETGGTRPLHRLHPVRAGLPDRHRYPQRAADRCIACAACVDVCDSVMDKMDYPQGLIRYTTENALEGKPVKLLRPRVLIYTGLLAAIVAALVISVLLRVPLKLDVIRDRNALYRETVDENDRKHLHAENHEHGQRGAPLCRYRRAASMACSCAPTAPTSRWPRARWWKCR